MYIVVIISAEEHLKVLPQCLSLGCIMPGVQPAANFIPVMFLFLWSVLDASKVPDQGCIDFILLSPSLSNFRAILSLLGFVG